MRISIVRIFFSIMIVGTLLFTGCPQPTGEDGTNITDTDGDWLSDEEEMNIYGTNPILSDTDGDGYTDGEEITTYQFNPAVNPHKFNPRVADVPKIGIRLESLPAIIVHYTTSEGSSHTESQDWGTETATSRSRDTSSTSTRSTSHSAGIKLGAEQEFGLNAKSKVSVELSYTFTSTSSNSTSFSQSQTASKRDTYNNCRSYERNNSYSEAKGELQTVVDISNIGDIAFTVKNLYLKATEFDPEVPDSLAPICGLNRDTGASTFQSFSLAPGQSFELKYGGDMDLGTTHNLLRDTENLVIDVESYELVDENGKPYIHNTTEIGAKTASIVIDYGPGLSDSNGNPLVPGKFLVSTNFKRNDPGVSLASIINDILQYDYEIGSVTCNSATYTNLKTFNGITADGAQTGDTAGYWILIHSYTRSGVDGTDWYTPDMDYDVLDIDVQAGDQVLVFHTEDKDGDGLTARQELSWGTDDDNVNTDGDTYGNDYEEATDDDDSTHPAIDGPVSDDSVDRASLPDGVTLFEHADFEGDYRTFTPLGDGNIADLSQETLDAGANADNLISSVVVKGEYQVALYDRPYFRGKKVVLTEDDSYLPDTSFNDLASSMKVIATDGTGGLSFATFASISPSGDAIFHEFEDIAIGDFVDTGGTGYCEVVHADASDYFYIYQYDNGTRVMNEVKTFDTRAAFGVPFDRAKDSNDYWIYGDRIASGDFYNRSSSTLNTETGADGDYIDEIIYMDVDNNIYVIDPRSTASDKTVSDILGYASDPGDCIGAGNLDGVFPGWEFATVLRGPSELEFRYPNNGELTDDQSYSFSATPGDQMAVGELNGDDRSELILLIHDLGGSQWLGEIQIVDIETGNIVAGYTPSTDIMPWDSISAGDVNGDGIDEIIWGALQEDQGDGDIYVISWDGSGGSSGFSDIGSITNVFYRGDIAVAGDLNADGVAEIVHGSRNDGKINIYTKQ